MARTILIAVKDLLFGSKIQAAGKRTGVALSWAPRFDRLRDVVAARQPDVLVADLAEPGMLDEIAAIRAASPSLRMVCFAGHVNETVITEAEKLAVTVLTKGQFAAQLDRLLVTESTDEAPDAPSRLS